MDNLTHTMVGVAMAKAGLSQRFGKGTVAVLAVASNLPDVDAIWAFLGFGDMHLSRRMLTHSVLGMPLLAGAGAAFFRLFYKHISWGALFGLCLLAIVAHLLFDLVNSYGVVVLYPFSIERFELAWVFIIDLALWALLLGPLVLGPLLKRRVDSRRVWQAALVLVALYVGVCAGGRWHSQRVLDGVAAEGSVLELSYVFPEALGPHRFRGVLKEPDGPYRVYLIHVPSSKAELMAEFETEERHPAVRAARASERGQELEWFFKAPVWRVLDTPDPAGAGGVLCEAYDLRFHSVVVNRGIFFRYQFRVTNGRVEPIGWQRGNF